MQARDIMTRPAITLRDDTPVLAAAAVLREKQIAAAPVVDHDDKLVGMLTRADLVVPRFPAAVRAQLPSHEAAPATTQTVGQVMTTAVIAMSPSSPVASLAQAMFDYDLRTIPIVIGMTIVGIVSRRDLLWALVPDDGVIRAELTCRLRTYIGGQSGWDLAVHDGEVQIRGAVEDDAEAASSSPSPAVSPG